MYYHLVDQVYYMNELNNLLNFMYASAHVTSLLSLFSISPPSGKMPNCQNFLHNDFTLSPGCVPRPRRRGDVATAPQLLAIGAERGLRRRCHHMFHAGLVGKKGGEKKKRRISDCTSSVRMRSSCRRRGSCGLRPLSSILRENEWLGAKRRYLLSDENTLLFFGEEAQDRWHRRASDTVT